MPDVQPAESRNANSSVYCGEAAISRKNLFSLLYKACRCATIDLVPGGAQELALRERKGVRRDGRRKTAGGNQRV